MKRFINIMFGTLYVGVLVCIMMSCSGGGSDDDAYKAPTIPTSPDQPSTPQTDGQVKATCTICNGNKKCLTCNGTGKGCNTCNGTGIYCKSCNSTGKDDKCNGTGKCKTCNGSGKYCKECDGDGECYFCDNGNCNKCKGKGTLTCSYCSGSGKCQTCNGLGWYLHSNNTCTTCRGSKTCKKCDGSKKEDCYSCRGTGNCDECDGTNICQMCKGNPICKTCSGSKNCTTCNGTGSCPTCSGSPKCKTCGGDGHCATCKNSNGLCYNCNGEGFIYCDYSLSPNPIELSHEGGDKSISITTYKKWKVSSNTSWLTIKDAEGSGNGSFILNATPNIENESRSATIYISYDGKSASIPVKQNAADANQNLVYSNTIKNLLKFPMMINGLDLSKPVYNELYTALNSKYVTTSGCYGDPNYYGWICVSAEDNPNLNIDYRNWIFNHFWLTEDKREYTCYIDFYYEFQIKVSDFPDPMIIARRLEKDYNNANIPIKYNSGDSSSSFEFDPLFYDYLTYSDFVDTYYPNYFTYGLSVGFGFDWSKSNDEQYWLFRINGKYHISL